MTLERIHKMEELIIQRLKSLVEMHSGNHRLDISQLCLDLGISRAHLYRKIKQLTGRSVAIYVRFLRFSRARTLLLETQMTVTEVAFEVGFRDLPYFSKSFKKEFGISPSQIRA